MRRAVDQFELHVVVADDDDVLDAVVVDQRLEAAEPKERVEGGLGGRLLSRRAPCALTGIGRFGHGRLDEVEDDRPSELLLSGPVEAIAIGRDHLTQLLRGLGAKRRDDRPVDVGAERRWRADRAVETN